MRQYRCIVGPYRVTGVQRTDASGTLLNGEYSDTGLKVAIREIKVKPSKLDATRSRIVRELNILKSSTANFTVRLFDVIEEPGRVFVVTERTSTSLKDRIERYGPVAGSEARRVIAQLVAMVDFLHSDLKVCHRHICPENIAFDRYNNVRVVGFASAQQLLTPNQTFPTLSWRAVETLAPEMARRKQYGKAVDIWALGCVVYYMLVGKYPFEDISVQGTLQKVVCDEPRFPDGMDDVVVDLLKKMLQKDPDARITSTNLMKHPYFAGFDFGALLKAGNFVEAERVDEFLARKGVEDRKDLTARAIANREIEIEDMREHGSTVPLQNEYKLHSVDKDQCKEAHELSTAPMMILAKSVMTRKGLIINQLARSGLTDAESDPVLDEVILKRYESS